MRTFTVDWRGPFNAEKDIPDNLDHAGVYFFCGKTYRQSKERLQYIGLTTKCFTDRHSDIWHSHFDIREETKSLYVGRVSNKKSHSFGDLALLEHCLISYLEPELNALKVNSLPNGSVRVISKWYFQNGNPRRSMPSLPFEMPDVLAFNGKEFLAEVYINTN